MAPRALILVSSARSGTNFVLDVLGRCVPGATVLGEIFRPGSDTLPELSALTRQPPEALLATHAAGLPYLWDAVCEAAAAQDRLVAAKIFYFHAPQRDPIWKHLRRTARPLHLMRRNLLRAHVSLEFAKATGVWQLRNPNQPYDPPPLRLDREAAENFIRTRRAKMAWARRFFAGPDYREVFYEDIEDSAERCAAALAALGIIPPGPPETLEVRFRRQGAGSLAERVANYDELRHLDREEPALPPQEAAE